MPVNKRFNIRVYGIWMRGGEILVNDELIRGQLVTKFPGGGLEWGEGTIACLKREWLEELDLEIDVLDHFYTTDYFQPSAYDDSQVVSIYYWVHCAADPATVVNLQPDDKTYWISLQEINSGTFTLPIDQKVGNMLHQLYDEPK